MSRSPGERGSALILALGIISMTVAVGGLAIVSADLLRHARSVQSVANSAALAASDVARGVVSGQPCRVARHIATQQGVRLESCVVSDGLATVIATANRYGFRIEKAAAAKPAHSRLWELVGR